MLRTANILCDTHFISLPSARDRHETEMFFVFFCRWIDIVFYSASLRLFLTRHQNCTWVLLACYTESFLSLVQAEVFLCSLTVWESKSHSIYWTDHQGCPLWHVMTHTASFLLFVSVAEGNWWCCQDMLYTIKRGAERRLSCFSPTWATTVSSSNFAPRALCLTFPWKKTHIDPVFGGWQCLLKSQKCILTGISHVVQEKLLCQPDCLMHVGSLYTTWSLYLSFSWSVPV